MSTQVTIKRYTLLIEKISQGKGPSFSELKDWLEEQGFSISQRTLQRDIEQIRAEFGVEITYDRLRNGYVINNEEGTASAGLTRFLEILGTAELLGEQLKKGENPEQYISFEAQGNLKGIENLGLLLPAIKAKRKVEFIHENYETGKLTNYVLHPYLLREYLNRWYVFGKVEGKNALRTFGIDRIKDLQVKRDKFHVERGMNPKDYFKDIIGLNTSDEDVETVIIRANPTEAKYLRALPLHTSQKILKEDKEAVEFSLEIKPNYEFKQRVLMMMDRARIIKPDWLVEEIREDIKRMGERYRKK